MRFDFSFYFVWRYDDIGDLERGPKFFGLYCIINTYSLHKIAGFIIVCLKVMHMHLTPEGGLVTMVANKIIDGKQNFWQRKFF